jgi:hypothetical protein
VTSDFDFVSPLAMGDIRAEGLDLTLIRVCDSVERGVADSSIHGGEASFSRDVRRISTGDSLFVGFPVFLVRAGATVTDVRCCLVPLRAPLAALAPPPAAGLRLTIDLEARHVPLVQVADFRGPAGCRRCRASRDGPGGDAYPLTHPTPISGILEVHA